MQHNWKTKDFLTEISNDGVILTRNLFRLSKHKGSEFAFDHFDMCVNWDDPHQQDCVFNHAANRCDNTVLYNYHSVMVVG